MSWIRPGKPGRPWTPAGRWGRLLLPFALDLRAIAAVRIAIAACVLADLTNRARDLAALYSDDGLLPRRDLLEHVTAPFATTPSLLLASGDTAWVAVFFACAFVAATALLVGYRGRAAAVATWFALASIHLRNPLVLYGVDPLLRIVPLWLALLPSTAVWSIDAARAESPVRRPTLWVGLAGAGLLLQLFLLYFVAGVAKAIDPSWLAGTGLGEALDYRLMVRPAGQWLHGHALATMVLNYGVLVLELFGPFAFFVSDRRWRWRVATVFALVAMHAGILATMTVGFFVVAPVACLLAALPTSFWWKRSAWASGGSDPVAGVVYRIPAGRGRVGEALAAVMIVWTLVWNVGLFVDAGFQPPGPLRPVGAWLALSQKWGMFTQLGPTGVLEVRGRLEDGADVDLLAAGGPLPSLAEALRERSPAAAPAPPFRSIYWRIAFLAVTETPGDEFRLASFGRYYCREWNDRRTDGRTLATLQIELEARVPSADPFDPARAESSSRTLWVHNCFG